MEPAPPPAQGDPWLQIGGSADDGSGFVQWHDANPKPKIIAGIQGGQHIWVSMRTRDVWPKKALLGVTMHRKDTGELVQPGKIERIVSELANYGTFYGFYGFVAYVSEPCVIRDRALQVTAEVSDLYGVVTTDTAVVTPTWDGLCAPQP